MAEESDNRDEADKGKGKESSQNEEEDTCDDTESAESDTDDEDDEEDEEPKLKYARLTSQLGAVYRNGDATSSFLVTGDKMIIGTHNGNIHVLSLPSFESLRVYTAHSASVTSISVSPFPPPLPTAIPEGVSRIASHAQPMTRTPSVTSDASAKGPRTPKAQVVPNIPSNAIYIATSSIDGKVCVISLVDMKDVQLRNFSRPVQAVAVSPDYKTDRTYVSGGLAGNLVLTTGGRAGTSSTSTTVGTASATASGWLGSIGLGGNSGQDTILHSGEGTISTIKWSLSGKYVAWVNEHGVRIMRSHMHLESTDANSAWKRVGHVGRPQDNGWEEMAGVWKARVEWIDEAALETDEDDKGREVTMPTPATAKLKQQASKSDKRIEKLIIGWGGTVWIINVHPEGPGVGVHGKERTVGRAEIIKILRMDCIISGLSLYTPTLLLVLAYMSPDEEENEDQEESDQKIDTMRKGHKSQPSTGSTSSEPRGGIRHRANALTPELRLIDLKSSEEVDTDQLTVSRFERLSTSDYHLGVLPAPNNAPISRTPRGTLESLTGMGSSLWNATINAKSLLNSGSSIHSTGSNSERDSSRAHGPSPNQGRSGLNRNPVHPHLASPGMKIFIHSPYDCILATKRDLSDHLSFLLEHHKYQQSWELIDESPEVISTSPQKLIEIDPISSDHPHEGKDDFYDDITSTVDSASRLINSSVEKEKRRIGELWIQQLVEQGDWATAGSVCGKVLGTSPKWKDWVYTFAAAKKFDEIVNFIPTEQVQPPLDSTIYEVTLGFYITHNRPRARELFERWSAELFNVKSVTTILENQLKYHDVRESGLAPGEAGDDWRIIVESLARLYVADGRPREALKYYFKLQDADMAMSLIREYHLVDAVVDDIPGFILLRVTDEQKRDAPIEELRETTSEAINLLVSEAQHGLVKPSAVVNQLQEKGLTLYLFFYLRSLWNGDAIEEGNLEAHDRLVGESKTLVDAFADLAVHIFSLYDRDLLMEFLKSSTYYTFEKATAECEDRDFVPELVYLYSKTGQTKRALYLIIDRLADVSQAIAFAKEQDDADLWEDLLNYSMDKPRFIRGLLEEVGTAIDPITLVRRIPEGLAIEGLRDGLSRMIKEYELQHSISLGVAKVLRSEVRLVQNTLRSGQRRGIKFDVAQELEEVGNAVALDESEEVTVPGPENTPPTLGHTNTLQAGHCVGCHEAFTEHEMETLVGFACGHVFHLSHLLNFHSDDRPVTPPNIDIDENGEIAMTYSIGAKVTHARLLKDRIRDGCPICISHVTKAAS